MPPSGNQLNDNQTNFLSHFLSFPTKMDWCRGQVIGHGSSAIVYLATSSLSNDIFAVKSVVLAQSECLMREQGILSSLNCPHIVSYRGCSVSTLNHNLMYNIFMEYMPGGTLRDAICKHGGRLDESMIGFYGRQILQGLEYLHSTAIVHCDIKGTNLLIGEEGNIKLADFGCSKRVVDLNSSENRKLTLAGTPMHMAPEVVKGKEQGIESDIWSFGCTVIEMATGFSPWHRHDSDPISTLYRIASSDELPELPSFLSSTAKDFLSKCLRRNQKERWSASELLRHPFMRDCPPIERALNFEKITCPVKVQESSPVSPTSVLDHSVWNTLAGSRLEAEINQVLQETSGATPAGRIERLASEYGLLNWDCGETWINIREGNEGESTVTEWSSHYSKSPIVDDSLYFVDWDNSCRNVENV